MDEWVLVLAALAAGAGLVAFGAWALPRLRNEEQGYPWEAEIEAALVPLIFSGICAAYRLSEWGMDQVGERLSGLDKKRIADHLYSLLPEEIAGFDIELVKRVVPRERFEELVQGVFDRFDRHFVQFADHYEKLFEEWKASFQLA